MENVEPGLLAFSQSISMEKDPVEGGVFGENRDERTRGIKIWTVEDGDIVVSIWDLVGQD